MRAGTTPEEIAETVSRAECEFETALTPEELKRCVDLGVFIPPGALKVLFNRMKYVWYRLTNDPNDPLVKSGTDEKVFAPDSLRNAEKTNTPKTEATVANAMVFSSHTDDMNVFESTECSYQEQKGLNPAMDGILFDKYAAAAMKEGDSHVHCDKDGNLIAIFIMPKGWVTEHRGNGVCHMCGRFPVHVRCPQCLCARFCTDLCMLRAKEITNVHSDEICKQFITTRMQNMMTALSRAVNK